MRRLLGLALALLASAAQAETGEVRIAQQYGLIFLPLHVAIEHRLIERNAAAAGVPDLKVTLLQTGSGAAMNDALLSGNVDIATGGSSVLLTVADRPGAATTSAP